jgi:nucleotide-binding universal stress UspA family protein
VVSHYSDDGACQPGPNTLPRYGRILVALDGSELSERVLPHIQALAKEFGARVTLLRVIAPSALVTEVPEGAVPGARRQEGIAPCSDVERQEVVSYLTSVAARLQDEGLSVDFAQREGPAAEVIVEQARDLRADLIAMSTHGRGALARMVLGSVAGEVLRSAPCPVLLVRAHQPAARATWHLPSGTPTP